MLWTIATILLILWLIGLLTEVVVGGLLHLLLVLAVVIVIVNLVRGRRRA